MYSEPAVECGLVTNEVVNQRRYGALPLSYGAASTSGDGGIRTGHRPKGGHTRLFKHVLQFSSRSYCGGDEGWSELGPSCTPSSQLGLYCDRPTKG